jgi:hypothetical protein
MLFKFLLKFSKKNKTDTGVLFNMYVGGGGVVWGGGVAVWEGREARGGSGLGFC